MIRKTTKTPTRPAEVGSAQTAVAEYGTTTPAALRRLADLLEGATAAAPTEVAGHFADERADWPEDGGSVGPEPS